MKFKLFTKDEIIKELEVKMFAADAMQINKDVNLFGSIIYYLKDNGEIND